MWQAIRSLIAEAGLEELTHPIMDLVRPSIRITLHPNLDSLLPPGISRIGGAPHFPPDFQWPQWNGVSLLFLAQISLADITAYDSEGLLPKTGILYFFYDREQPRGYDATNKDAARMLYYPGDKLSYRGP